MRILYHHRTQGRGVEAVHILGIVNALRSMGHEVDILSPPGVTVTTSEIDSKQSNSAKFFRRLSKHAPEIIFELAELIYNFTMKKRIRAALNKKKYDLLFERYALMNWVGCTEAQRKKVPFMLEINYTSYTPINRQRSHLSIPIAHSIDSLLLKNADGFVAVSSYLKKHLVSLGVREDKVIVLPNAADTELFYPDISVDSSLEKIRSHGKKIVGFVGNFHLWHGIDLLLGTITTVREKCPEVAYVLVGDGPERNKIMERVEKENLGSSVFFPGRIRHDNIPNFIAGFDIAVMPHSNIFGSPMKILEYMASAKPVVAPRLSPIEDVIDDGQNGILFQQLDKKSLSNALIQLLTNNGLRKKMGAHGRKKTIDKHNWANNAEEILKLYDRIVLAKQ